MSNTNTHIISPDQTQDYAADSLSQYPHLTPHENHSLTGFIISPNTSAFQHSQQCNHGQQGTGPLQPFADFSSQSYPSGIQDHAHDYSDSMDVKFIAAEASTESSAFGIQEPQRENPELPVSMAIRQGIRSKVLGVVLPKYGEGMTSSLDGSRTTSPISPQEFATFSSSRAGSNAARSKQEDDDAAEDKYGSERPAWSELKTKAGKERKRLPLACIACRRKKIRCSGEKPTCKHCQHSRIPCVYRVTTRKPAPRTDYMSMLDKRLKRMEERVLKTIPKDDADRGVALGRANVRPSWTGQGGKASTNKKRIAGDAFGNELEEWAHPKTPSLPLKGIDVDEQARLMEGAESLPPKEVQEHLSEVFFEYLYGQSYHLLHKPSYMRRLQAKKVPPVLILAVCAISARFSTHPLVNSEPPYLRGEKWAAPARDIAIKRYDEPSITVLTALLILGLHEFGTCQGGRSWMLGGMAMRMAYALRLHRELDHDRLWQNGDDKAEPTSIEQEIRRRTMWACFLMDRFNSSGTERPAFSSEETIEVQLPIKESHFLMEISGPTECLNGNFLQSTFYGDEHISSPRENMGVAAYMIRIIALWGRVVQYLNLGGRERDVYPIWNTQSGFANLKKQADDFQTSLPMCLKNSQDNLKSHAAEKLANQFVFMHIVFYQVILFLHYFAVPTMPGSKPQSEIPKDFAAEAVRTAITAADRISLLLDDALDHLVVAPFAGYCAFTSSTVQIWGIFSKNQVLEAASKRNLARNVAYLSRMKKYWGMFHYMGHNLSEIYHQHLEASTKGNINEVGNLDRSIFQYGDWFKKYPHGIPKSNFEEFSSNIKKEPRDEAIITGRSHIQNIEDFFNSVSPPTGSLPTHPHKFAKKSSKRATMQAVTASLPHYKQNNKPDPHHLSQSQPSSLLSLQLSSNPQLSPTHNNNNTYHSPQHAQPDFYQASPVPPPPYQPTAYEQHLHPQAEHSLNYGGFAGSGPDPIISSSASPSSMGLNNIQEQNTFPVYSKYTPLTTLTPQQPLPDNTTSQIMQNNSPNQILAGGAAELIGWSPNNAVITIYPENLQQQIQQQGDDYHCLAETGGDLHTSGWFMPYNLNPPDISWIPLENSANDTGLTGAAQTNEFMEGYPVDRSGGVENGMLWRDSASPND